MKKIIFTILLSLTIAVGYGQSSIPGCIEIGGIIDFDLFSGGYSGKAIHLNIGCNTNLSGYGIGVANNGNGGDGEEYSFPNINVYDNDGPILLARDTSALAAYLGACYDQFQYIFLAPQAIDQNGNDAIELYQNGNLVEIFGDVNVDGTGTPWEYLDSWAYRNSWTDGSFILSDWSFGGVECTIGSLTTQSSSCPYPFCATSTTENDLRDVSFNIYPNPSTDIIYFDSEIIVDNIRLIDAIGKEVNDYSFDNKVLNVSALSSGIYFIQIEFNDMLFSQKFFKN